MPFGSQTDEPTARQMIDLAVDAGVTFFDTANVYSGGRSEEIVGRALRHRRDRFVLATKVGDAVGDLADDRGLSRAAIRKAVEASLRRLQTEYIDVYYLHAPDDDVAADETVAAMDEAVRAGKIRYVAVSNYSAWQIADLVWIARSGGYAAPAISQPLYNLLARGIEREYLPMTQHFGLANVAYNPLAGGLLTGKHDRRKGPIEGSRFDPGSHRLGRAYLDRYWNEGAFAAVETLADAARSDGRSLVSVALGWLLHHTPVDVVVVGASQPEQLLDNLDALKDGPLSPDLLTTCTEVGARLPAASVPKYNR
jgi:1-deoxyxylulose-5-phosphate synthase